MAHFCQRWPPGRLQTLSPERPRRKRREGTRLVTTNLYWYDTDHEASGQENAPEAASSPQIPEPGHLLLGLQISDPVDSVSWPAVRQYRGKAQAPG